MIIKIPMPDTRSMRRYALAYFYRTGEPINPYRCEACATKRQIAEYNRRGAASLVSYPGGIYRSICCRKCGIDFRRIEREG